MNEALMNLPCTVIRRETSAERDDYGDEIRDETTESTSCELQQLGSSEPSDEAASTTYTLFLPADVEIDQDDAVVINGHLYELAGTPDLIRNPRTQQDSHIEVSVRRAAGADDGGS
jgi:hypothetical protein